MPNTTTDWGQGNQVHSPIFLFYQRGKIFKIMSPGRRELQTGRQAPTLSALFVTSPQK